MNDNHDIFPETAQEALAKWDAGETVFTVEMGGLGPGYEMAIQGLAFEMMRELIGFDRWDDDSSRADMQSRLDAVTNQCDKLPWGGFSGAQVGAAQNLASIVCKKGYRVALGMDAVKDRLIQICKHDLRQESGE